MTQGCVQGSICGPTFWNLILDELLEQRLPYGCHLQAYADDVMLLVEGKTASDIEERANDALAIIQAWGERVKLEFSEIGITGNEAADVAAKEAAKSKTAKAYSHFPLSYAKYEIRQLT